jgi:glycosyltransferase involved in cell wall biosynthesis
MAVLGEYMIKTYKKLLFITWSISYGYGTEKSLADVLNRMDRTKYDISILPLFKNAESSIFKPDIKILDALIDYTEPEFDEEASLNHYYKLMGNPNLFNKAIKQQFDCIIACNHNAPSYFASYLYAPKKILWIRGDMSELDYRQYDIESNEYKMTRQEYSMQANVMKSFDSIVVISDVVQSKLKDLFGITKNVYKISNSVDVENIKLKSQEYVTKPSKMLFTTLGRIDYNKNQILLLKAANCLKQKRDDFMIYILGDGDERSDLETYIQENNLYENVKILGFIDNPYPYIKNSIATVLTSLSEGFSLALVESVVLNTPIISTDVGVARELIDKYDCGDLIDYNEEELASVMIRYMNNYDGCNKIYSAELYYDIMTEVKKTEGIIDMDNDSCSKYKKLQYPEITIHEVELDNIEIPVDSPVILRVIRNKVPYEYLINKKSSDDRLIVFNNGAVPGGNVTFPVFQRHTWMTKIETSAIFCMDPTLYISGCLQLGWGIGKNDDYYLENSSHILKKIIGKMGISLENTVIYGTSAGGYLSIIMGIYLKGAKVVADNAQLDVRNWIFKDALDSVITFCFDNIGDALKYKERFSVIDAFEKHGYVPKIYLHVNMCSSADNSMQLIPFLKYGENLDKIREYNDIEIILHHEPQKGHDGICMEEAIEFINSCF